MKFPLVLVYFFVASGAHRINQVSKNAVTFTVFSHNLIEGKPSPIGDDSWQEGCSENGTIVVITHGYNENYEKTPWIKQMIQNYLDLYKSCVFFMDYSKVASITYFDLLLRFDGISAVLREKLLTLGDPSNIQMFGFSFGARVAIEAAIDVAKSGRKIDKIFACEPTRPGFELYQKDPQTAANFVQCINTSIDKGTNVYNCHQNWRLGNCGYSQIAAQGPPMGSHGLCPYFFNKSFHNDYLASKSHKCTSWRPAKDLPNDYKMGPRESRTSYVGDIFVGTSKTSPWTVIDNNVSK